MCSDTIVHLCLPRKLGSASCAEAVWKCHLDRLQQFDGKYAFCNQQQLKTLNDHFVALWFQPLDLNVGLKTKIH